MLYVKHPLSVPTERLTNDCSKAKSGGNSQFHIKFVVFLADPGKVRGCSTNTVMIYLFMIVAQ